MRVSVDHGLAEVRKSSISSFGLGLFLEFVGVEQLQAASYRKRSFMVEEFLGS